MQRRNDLCALADGRSNALDGFRADISNAKTPRRLVSSGWRSRRASSPVSTNPLASNHPGRSAVADTLRLLRNEVETADFGNQIVVRHACRSGRPVPVGLCSAVSYIGRRASP
jgi:hypothetical protein